jgi:acyl-ACP thioesterase
MVLVFRQADVVRLPRYGENITVQTSVFECGSFLGYRNTILLGEDGSPCVLTWSVGAFVARETGKLARLPKEVADTLILDERVPMDYQDKRIVLPEVPGRILDPFPVRRGDIDLNNHMNNARYVEAAMELLPGDFRVKRLRIEYKSPARPGALLYPRVCASPDGPYYILLTDAYDRPYTVMEFS